MNERADFENALPTTERLPAPGTVPPDALSELPVSAGLSACVEPVDPAPRPANIGVVPAADGIPVPVLPKSETTFDRPVVSSLPVYGRTFWLAYLANSILVMANALTFRFAELVAFLGKSEQVAGDIVAFGLVVAVVARLSVSHWLDLYGTRRMWTVTTLLYISGALLFLVCQRAAWELYVARAAYFVGLTGMFACSMTHIQNSVPPERRTEVIGNLGSSGFVGMICGAHLGDLVLKVLPPGRLQFMVLFGTAAVIGVAYLVIVRLLTRGQTRPVDVSPEPTWRLLFRYWPGTVVIVSMVMGLGITVTTVFLTRFATSRHIEGLGIFFTGYAISAFVFRLTAQNWSRTIGRHWMLIRGLCGHMTGHLLLSFCSEGWHLIIPSIVCGFGHALLFPAVVSLGAGAFPKDSRGAGTAMILAFTDLGSLIASPLLGRIIVLYGFETMFVVSAGIACAVALTYLVIALRYPDEELQSRPLLVIGPGADR